MMKSQFAEINCGDSVTPNQSINHSFIFSQFFNSKKNKKNRLSASIFNRFFCRFGNRLNFNVQWQVFWSFESVFSLFMPHNGKGNSILIYKIQNEGKINI